MIRTAVPVAALALAGILPAGASSAGRPPITQSSSGKTIHLVKGGRARLRLSNRWRWSDPRVSTKAVRLTPVAYFVDPGFSEWTINTRKVGRATIRSVGTPNCSTCALTTRSFRVTIVVR
jgi:hypothetical protein